MASETIMASVQRTEASVQRTAYSVQSPSNPSTLRTAQQCRYSTARRRTCGLSRNYLLPAARSPQPAARSPQPAARSPQPAIVSSSFSEIAAAVEDYRRSADVGVLFDRLRLVAQREPAGDLAAASVPYRDMPEVVIPLYERIVDNVPDDAQAMVILANAYWLSGRGPDMVGPLAARAISVDPSNRGAWHLWALSEPTIRERVARWQQVSQRFPEDHLARAALADNAVSLASTEHDPLALDLAIATYESLLEHTNDPQQRAAVKNALKVLGSWRL